MSRRPDPAEEAGFTLIEMVVTVAIVGVVVTALTGVVLSYLRTTVDTQARLSESHDVQFVSAYWQRDVASIGVRSSTYDTATHTFPLAQSVDLPACALSGDAAGASPVVTLAWTEHDSLTSTDPGATVKVTYAYQTSAEGGRLFRVRCGSRPATVEVADRLAAAPVLACADAAGAGSSCTGAGEDVPVVVTLALSIHDSTGIDLPTYAATLLGERRQT
ncbi:prepilin-type N-terminal cleavage/methylation domain-containing protein [Nocardioides sp. NPDC057577]|uniref:prepilin-type N-terminal cleavage/methylation domain-containing protein n=1 Tax=Nocardioides sp. NPDC057577 TaxID=3346171 RepID=UPI0036722FB7